MHVWRVKSTTRATHKWDFYEPVGTINGQDAFTPLSETGCALGRS
jgi:hypothetical protein